MEEPQGQVCFPRYKRYFNIANTLTVIVLLIVLGTGVYWLSGHFIKPIDGPSMQPGINNNENATGDIALVARYADVKRGDIVIIDMTESKHTANEVNKKSLIKRVIALGGDKLRIVNNNGIAEIYVNGKLIEEDYVSTQRWCDYYDDFNDQSGWVDWKDAWGRSTLPQNPDGSITIPDGYFFFMGDNRTQSYDGRCMGPMPLSYVMGVVETILPVGSFWNNFIMFMF